MNDDGGALAVANADLGELSRTVAPLARDALETGLDLAMYVSADASLVGVVIAAIALRRISDGAPGEPAADAATLNPTEIAAASATPVAKRLSSSRQARGIPRSRRAGAR